MVKKPGWPIGLVAILSVSANVYADDNSETPLPEQSEFTCTYEDLDIGKDWIIHYQDQEFGKHLALGSTVIIKRVDYIYGVDFFEVTGTAMAKSNSKYNWVGYCDDKTKVYFLVGRFDMINDTKRCNHEVMITRTPNGLRKPDPQGKNPAKQITINSQLVHGDTGGNCDAHAEQHSHDGSEDFTHPGAAHGGTD